MLNFQVCTERYDKVVAGHSCAVDLLMEPTCSVYHTRLYANAFELVTTQGALHLYGSSKEETEAWIDALRGAIANSRGLSSDPLLSAARRIPLETYDVHFATKQKLNIVLERVSKPSRAAEAERVRTAMLRADAGESVFREGSAEREFENVEGLENVFGAHCWGGNRYVDW